MRDTNLVNALRKHAADWIEAQVKTKMARDIIGATRTAFEQSADRIVAAEESALVLKKEIEKLRAQLPRWIPVEERLPENGVPVLINYIGSNDGKYHPDGTAAWTDHGCFWWEGSLEDCDTEVAVPITHWMPLPEPPEVEL